jgi:uncharacterized protein YdaU (DUF1376 family)
MAKPDTWMPLYIGDYLADTMHLEAREHGAYLLLLMHYWRTGPLENDPRGLAVIARVDRRVWASDTGPIVMRFFEVRDGYLHQKRMDAELAEAKENSDVKRAAARKRWDGPTKKTNGPGPEGNASADAYASPHASQVHAVRTCPLPSPSPSLSNERESPLGPPKGGRRRRGEPKFSNGFAQIAHDLANGGSLDWLQQEEADGTAH